ERLEFLGDAVLGLVIAQCLFEQFPNAEEGDLSRLRASLVNKPALVSVANELELGASIHLGEGERKSGGQRRESILADTVEALIGAIYLDGGFASASDTIQRLYEQRLRELPDAATLKDAKTRLQEYLQGKGLPLPQYEIVETHGKAHQQRFVVKCEIDSQQVNAEGTSRQRAEQAAAEKLLEQLGLN
ncbi:MAG: ribonuclease III, partial [Gammaproteobacteria bacterium]|nr:ribonuclease III [Gammaproteobacteria bacterium]